MDQVIWGNSLRDWLIAIGIIAGCLIIARLIKSIIISRIRKMASGTKTTLDDFIVSILDSTVMPFLYIVGVYSGLQYLYIDPRIQRILHATLLVVSIYYIIRLITKIIGYLFERALNKNNGHHSRLPQAKGLLIIINIVIWTAGLLFLINNLGYNITSILAGLGIGGIAIALAAQTVLGDLFSYFVIFFDKPFEVGDFIVNGDKMGTVESIGVKTTRIRALSGEELIFSNTALTNSSIQNFKRMMNRRIVFTFKVVYETPTEKLKIIPGIIRKIIEAQPDVKFDRAHFVGFGDFSLNFEVVYIVLTDDYNVYMDRQQAIYLAIAEEFKKEKIDFALPSQKLMINNEDEDGKKELTDGVNSPDAARH